MSQVNKSYFWAWDDHQGWNYTTYFSFFNDFYRDDEDMKYVELASLVILSVISVIINVSLIVFIAKSRHLHSQQNMYTVNVLASSLLILPVALLVGLTRLSPSGWQFGDFACRTSLVLYVTTAFIKIWLMTLISVERYLKVVHSPNRHISRRSSIAVTIAAWIVPALTLAGMAYPNTESKETQLDVDTNITICSVQFKYHPTIPNAVTYFGVIFIIEFVIPASIMIASYALIMKKIRKTFRVMAHRNSKKKKSKRITRERRTTLILIAILTLFLIMWTPLFGLLAMLSLDQKLKTFKLSSRCIVGQLCMLLLNTIIEPVLLSFTTGQVRQQLAKALRIRRGISDGLDTTEPSNSNHTELTPTLPAVNN